MKKYTIVRVSVLLAAVLLGTACAKKSEQTQPVSSSAVESQTTAESTTQEATKPETSTAEETTKEVVGKYHLLQGTVVKAQEDGTAFALQADDGKNYDINVADIADVEVEIAEDVQIAIAYIGEPLGNLKDVTLVVALPEQEEWSILTAEGTTTGNAMSSFTIETKDGKEIGFLKDNCPIEADALSADSGDKVSVTYVNSQDMNFPLEIRVGK